MPARLMLPRCHAGVTLFHADDAAARFAIDVTCFMPAMLLADGLLHDAAPPSMLR